MSTHATTRDATTVAYLIAIQVVSRGLTFIGNQALLRYVSPEHLGLAVQLEALSVSVLYTARESLRVALQRSSRQELKPAKDAQNLQLQSAVNATYLVLVLGLLLGSLLGTFYLRSSQNESLHIADFDLAFWLYAAATVVELLSEPGFVIIQQKSLYKVRARAETVAAIARCVSACLGAVVMHRLGSPMSVLPFAIGQAFYAASLLFVYQWNAISLSTQDHFSIFPSRLASSTATVFGMFSKPLLALAGAFYGQSAFKWLLTQGDTLVLSFFADFRAQGIFALASNYGGLASRLLFQPVEESSRNVFGRLLHTEKTQDKNARSPIPQRQQAMDYLSTTLRLYLLLVLTPCVAILPRVFPVLVSALLGSGSQWNSPETITLLRVYSYYIPTLAINGVLDAFVASVATEVELGAQSLMMLGVTMIYLNAAYLGMTTLQLGAVGLVYANIINMLFRIGFSLWFTRAWIQQNLPPKIGDKTSAWVGFVRKATPSTPCLLTLVLVLIGMYGEECVKMSLTHTAVVTELSRKRLPVINMDLFDISYLFSAAIVLVSSIIATEREFLLDTIEPLLPQRLKTMLQPYVTRQGDTTAKEPQVQNST